MKLEIITPDKKLYEGEVSYVKLPGAEGSFEMLNNHAPIISTLKAGEIKLVDQTDTKFFDIKGGVVEMNNNKAIILAD